LRRVGGRAATDKNNIGRLALSNIDGRGCGGGVGLDGEEGGQEGLLVGWLAD